MSSFLIIYSSTDGHTKIICERITNFLNDGNLVKLLSLEEAKKIDLSNTLGELLAKRAKEKKISSVYFDRGGYKYHGRIKALADSLRKNGLKI